MKVRELIELLKTQPQELEVVMWNDEADDQLPVEDAVWEEGTSVVELLTVKFDGVEGEFDE